MEGWPHHPESAVDVVWLNLQVYSCTISRNHTVVWWKVFNIAIYPHYTLLCGCSFSNMIANLLENFRELKILEHQNSRQTEWWNNSSPHFVLDAWKIRMLVPNISKLVKYPCVFYFSQVGKTWNDQFLTTTTVHTWVLQKRPQHKNEKNQHVQLEE